MSGARIGVLSLGCPRNLVDTEGILGRLKAKGYKIVDIEDAEIAIVNTCAFVEDAKKESIDAILELIALKKEGRLRKVIVYGCLSQRYKTLLIKELPEIDAFVGKVSLRAARKRFAITPRHFAYLKICEGCINNCSFCIIPKIKGKFTSLSEQELFSKVAEFNAQGLAELNIIGQDITGYGLDLKGKPSLAALLAKISKKATRIPWIRLLYLYPSRVDDELLALIRDDQKFCKYIDLPLQHINSRILKLMRRSGTPGSIRTLIERIRRRIPDVALRTSFIVGFPSETEKEFFQLLEFIKEMRFQRLGAFIYSREEGTKAFGLKPQVPHKVGLERFNRLMSLQQEISAGINEQLLGKEMDVLIDEKGKDFYLGRSQYDAPEVDGVVYVHASANVHLAPGNIVRATITDTMEYDLVAEVVERKVG